MPTDTLVIALLLGATLLAIVVVGTLRIRASRTPAGTLRASPAPAPGPTADMETRVAATLAKLRASWLSEAHALLEYLVDLGTVTEPQRPPDIVGDRLELEVVAFQGLAYSLELQDNLDLTREQALDRVARMFEEEPRLSRDELLLAMLRLESLHELPDHGPLQIIFAQALCRSSAAKLDPMAVVSYLHPLTSALFLCSRAECAGLVSGMDPSPEFNLRVSRRMEGSAALSEGPTTRGLTDECLAFLSRQGFPTDDEVAAKLERASYHLENSGLAGKFVTPELFDMIVKNTAVATLAECGLLALDSNHLGRAIPLLTAAEAVLPWPSTLFGLAVIAERLGNITRSSKTYQQCVQAFNHREKLIDPDGWLGPDSRLFVALHDVGAQYLGYSNLDGMISDAIKRSR